MLVADEVTAPGVTQLVAGALRAHAARNVA